ncbi:hypothetical protein SynBMKMC1_01037 [Synechococcus sp. BMK-MC-1]|nr:hypothetical protein SynBMKMC1_01037 [Synechococcus sp. BMK-MC-1]
MAVAALKQLISDRVAGDGSSSSAADITLADTDKAAFQRPEP